MSVAHAQTRAAAGEGKLYPERPLRFVVPVAAGGGHDLVSRLVATPLGKALGQQIVIDNRAGGGGTVGASIVATSPPDGYTLIVGSISTHALNPALYKQLPFDPVRDFAPISLVATQPNVLVVHPSLPVATVKELVAYARARPGQVSYASAGVGVSSHPALELLKTMTGIDLVHVPYKGAGPATTELIGGQVQVMCTSLAGLLPHIRTNRVRALATTAARRSPQVPDVPTMIESGVPGFEVGIWFALFAPAATPKAIVTRLNTEVVKVLESPEIRDRLFQNGVEAVHSTPDELAAFVRSEVVKWAKVVKASGMKVD